MSAPKDGGLAFPCESMPSIGPSGRMPFSPGMTLRDHFAGEAMLGEIVSQGLEGRDADHIAAMAYEMAAAMIRAREVAP